MNNLMKKKNNQESSSPSAGGCLSEYKKAHDISFENPEAFWAERAETLVSWTRKWDEVFQGDFYRKEVSWFSGGRLNVSFNCLDRHLEKGRRNQAALIWQGENDDEVKVYTYQMLLTETCRFANVLKSKGVKKGDCVSIYLPMIPELVIAMLACARIGAVHSVIFCGFSSAALKNRIKNCGSKVFVTADTVSRGGRIIPLKPNADGPLDECQTISNCIVVRRSGKEISMVPGRDSWWHEEVSGEEIGQYCEPVEMDAGDTLFMLYTSGSTGKPKGVLHSSGGYLTYVLHTCQAVFRFCENDIHWCTADIGWITGHSYSVYGPLGAGATILIYEGLPLYPEAGRYWQIVEKFGVTVFYTAPAAIRALMHFGSGLAADYDLSSLRFIGSVGEPINPEEWNWYFKEIGQAKLPVIDTWWQTETGGIMLAPQVHPDLCGPGGNLRPLPGIDAAVLTESGREAVPGEGGRLVIRKPWPGMLKAVLGDGASVQELYFSSYSGVYDTGDSARRTGEHDFQVTGRFDDVIMISGHRLGTAEIESVLTAHRSVVEAAVVGVADSLEGQKIYAFVMVGKNVEQTPGLLSEIRQYVQENIGPVVTHPTIQYVSALPKTRSGKIMRRLLRKIASNDFLQLGDISTLADPSVITDLVEGKNAFSSDPCVPENEI
ncbi:acetate--CoA ligase [Desulfomarina sp.]